MYLLTVDFQQQLNLKMRATIFTGKGACFFSHVLPTDVEANLQNP